MQIIEKKRPDGSLRVAVSYKDKKTMTKRSERASCDINMIVKRFRKIHNMELADLKLPATREEIVNNFVNAPDFMEMQRMVAVVTQRFEALPADLRKRLDHNPANFIDYMNDPKNYKECVELGLVEKDRSAVRYVNRETGKVTNILGQVVGHLDDKGVIVEDNPAPVAPGAGSAPAGGDPAGAGEGGN